MLSSNNHPAADEAAISATPQKPSQALQQQQQQVAPLTPLQLRQWQREAQRNIRLATTAFKAGRTKAQDATDTGTAAATQLTNSLLTAEYFPSTQLPEFLKAIQGLQAAAVSKLRRQQQQHLRELAEAVQQVAAAVHTMEQALAAIKAQLGEQQQPQQRDPGTQPAPEGSAAGGAAGSSAVLGAASIEAVGGPASVLEADRSAPAPAVGPAAPASSSATAAIAAQCCRMPVFHILMLPEASAMLQRVLSMYQSDLQVKQQVLLGFEEAVSNKQEAGGSHANSARARGGGSSRQDTGGAAAEAFRRRLTVLITCWMTRPHVDDGEVAQLLQVLSDEMTGF